MQQPELSAGENTNTTESNDPDEYVRVIGRAAAESVLSGESVVKIARSDLQDVRIIAVDTLLEKREEVKEEHELDEISWTPPSPKKYPDWFKWDEVFADEMYLETSEFCWKQARYYESLLSDLPPLERYDVRVVVEELRRRGNTYFDTAVDGLTTSFEGMDSTGYMPNSRIMTKSGVMQAGLERRTIKKNGGNASVYTQPVLEPMAVLNAYKIAREYDPSGEMAKGVIDRFYEPTKLHVDYFDKHLTDGDGTRMVGIPHPHASGRDSDHLFDHAKNRLPRNGEKTRFVTNLRNIVKDYRHALNMTKNLVQAQGDLQKIRQHFWDKDVMFNCIYLENLYYMADLARLQNNEEDYAHYLQIAGELEIEMQTLWEPDAWQGNGAFLNVNKDGQVIRDVSVGTMVAFTLRGLTEGQLSSMMDMMEKSFNTPYGIPSIPTDSPNFDPHHKERERIWRGSSWDNVNWLILRGMQMHAERNDLPMELRRRLAKFAVKVEESSREALGKHWPPSEFRNPLDGKPQRLRVRPFTWAMLPFFMTAKDKLRYLVG